jgi:hypothetical protein
MRDDWLLDVLQDIERYAVLQKLDWLVPLVGTAYSTALRELQPTSGRPTETANTTTSIDSKNRPGDANFARDVDASFDKHRTLCSEREC